MGRAGTYWDVLGHTGTCTGTYFWDMYWDVKILLFFASFFSIMNLYISKWSRTYMDILGHVLGCTRTHWDEMGHTYSRAQELFYKLFSKITNKLVKYISWARLYVKMTEISTLCLFDFFLAVTETSLTLDISGYSLWFWKS